MRHSRRLPWVLLGGAAGALAIASPAILFIFLLAGLLALVLRAFSAPEDRRFVVGLFIAGLCVRMAVSLGLDLGSRLAEGEWPGKRGPVQGWEINVRDRTRSYLNLGDSDFYSNRAYALSEYVRGKRETVLFLSLKNPKPNGYLYAMGLFYHFFGFSPIPVKFLNCLIGALLAPLIFFIGRSCFNRAVGRWSAVLACFLPSLVLWSATNLKDPSFIALTALLFLLILRIQRADTPRAFLTCAALFLPVALLHMTLRSDTGFSWALIGCAFLSYGFARAGWKARLGALGALALLTVLFWPALFDKLTFAFYRHSGNVDAVSTPYTQTYRYLPESFYTGDLFQEAAKMKTNLPLLLTAIGKALSHYLLEPIPARTGDLPSLLIYPQMVLWYSLLPFMAVGAAWGMIRNLQGTAFLVATLLVWSLIGALAGGNIGLLFRIRDMTTPFFLILGCAGLWAWLGNRPQANRCA